MEEQHRFLTCYEEVGDVLLASRCAKVSRSAHDRWVEQDPTYWPRFQAARLRACRHLEDEALRRARHEVVRRVPHKRVPHKGKPVLVEGKRLYENKCSDQLMIKLLEAGDPDRFNREKAAPFDGIDTLTERQVIALHEWLKQALQTAKIQKALNEQGQQPAAEVAEAVAREAETPEPPSPIGFIPPFRGADGWPYKVERKKRKS
jgi:hypothetical protein